MAVKKTVDSFLVSLSSYTSPVIKENKFKDYVSYGEDNNYFQYLIDCYVNSTTHNSIVNGIASMIFGKGLDATDSSRKPNQFASLINLLPKKDLRKIIFERYLLGMGAMQIQYKGGQVSKISHFPMMTLRPAKKNKEGKIESWFYHPDWSNKKPSDKLKEIPVFGSTNQKNSELYIISPYVSGFEYFNPVDYQGCLPYAYLENEIADYLINDTINGFSGTKIINFNNGVPTKEVQEKIKDDVLKKVTGARGNKVLVSFNKSKDTQTDLTDIPLNDAPAHYQYLSDECENKILKGHKASTWLLGANSGGNGLGSNAEEIKNSMLVFDNLVIKTYQEQIIEAIDEVLAINDISLQLYFKTIQPLEFIDTEGLDAKTKEEETGVKMAKEFIDTTIADKLIAKADEDLEGWELVDERDVDYDLEDDFISAIEDLNSMPQKLTVLQKIVKLISTGTAKPNADSEQDKKIKDTFFKVRYKYYGNPNPERAFCKAMMSAGKIYRKEDIEAMSDEVVNAGLGEFGADTYDIFRFKGGARCKHSFRRLTFKKKDAEPNVTDTGNVGTRQAEILGYKITNPYQVSVQPNNLPLKGFSPRNRNLPSDVK